VCREDMGDGSAAEDGGAHRLDGGRREGNPLACIRDGRVAEKAVLVDQAALATGCRLSKDPRAARDTRDGLIRK
jgi:hypothetical protein